MKNTLFTIISLFLFSSQLLSQIITSVDTFQVNLINEYKISSLNIIPFSEEIFINKKKITTRDYFFDYHKGKFSLSKNYPIKFFDTIIVSYLSIQFELKKENFKRTLQIKLNEKNYDTIKISKSVSLYSSESIFGKDLQKSGTLIRGFSVGSNRDFTLNSGLRLQLSGNLSKEISIVAALSDENIPIQPEGNTETLEELDKVFIEIKHNNATATFGDYDFSLTRSEFSSTSRKLQGLMADINYANSNAKFSFASSRGKYNSNYFNGQDGNQGPYKLYGKNNERAIIIIANSERVYLDGNLMKRGENNDYTIDYSNGMITFTTKRIITSASRIAVEFEYSDLKFKRNFMGIDFSTNEFSNFEIGLTYLRDSDDENNPIDLALNKEQLNILKQAGNDRNKATINGVQFVGVDSLGNAKGVYVAKDTLINNSYEKIYVYSPGNSKAYYNVSFSFVGNSNGDYEKLSLGNYVFVGKNNGSYLPIIYLPLPELKQLMNFNINYKNEYFKFDSELSVSSYDRNKFSGIDDNSNVGFGRKILFELLPINLILSKINFGKLGLSIKDRQLDAKYLPFDRIDNIEFSRDYNLTSTIGQQILREVEANYTPFENIIFNSKYGYLKQGNEFISNRFASTINMKFQNNFLSDYKIDFVNSDNKILSTKWLKQNGKISYNINLFSAGIEYLNENKKEKFINKDSLNISSYIFNEINPFLGLKLSSNSALKISQSIREEDFPINGVLKKQSIANSSKLEFNFNELRELTSTINIGLRNKKYFDEFKKLGFNDNQTILIQSQNRINLLNAITSDFYYQAATEQTARLEKVFVKVQKGNGNYIYLGDLNNNGIADENEFQLSFYDADFILVTIPTEKLFPIIDMKSNFRMKVDFSKINFSENNFMKYLKYFSAETNFRIDEQNKDEKTSNIYLLKLSKFLNDHNTIRGSQNFLQDINVLQNNNELSFRFRFNQRKTLTQYSGGIEKGLYKEKSLRIRFKMIEEISNMTDFMNITDNHLSPAITNRSRAISSNIVISDFSYRPERNLEFGFKIEISRSKDSFPKTIQIIDLNSQLLRTNLSFENYGRLRFEIERTEINNTSANYTIPFEILKGNSIGKNYFARIFFDYKLSSIIQTSLTYEIRKQNLSKIIQNLRAEARAIF